jgi:hypothetical protein
MPVGIFCGLNCNCIMLMKMGKNTTILPPMGYKIPRLTHTLQKKRVCQRTFTIQRPLSGDSDVLGKSYILLVSTIQAVIIKRDCYFGSYLASEDVRLNHRKEVVVKVLEQPLYLLSACVWIAARGIGKVGDAVAATSHVCVFLYNAFEGSGAELSSCSAPLCLSPLR